MPTELAQLLTRMANRGEWRGAEAVLATARGSISYRQDTLAPERAPGRRLPGPVVAAVAAAVVLVAAGGLYLFLKWPPGEPAVTTTVPVTTTLPVTTTIAPPTTQPATTSTTEATTTTMAAVPPAPTPFVPIPSDLVLTWQQATSPSLAGGWLRAAVVGGPGIVGVGAATDGYHGDAAVWVSADGRDWTRVADEGGVFSGEGEMLEDGDQWMADIISWQGGFLAVGADGRGQNAEYDAAVWLSPDGVVWTRVPDQGPLGGPGPQWMNAVTAGGPGLVAVGMAVVEDLPGLVGRAAVWLSVDGLTWTALDPAAIEGAVGDGTGGRCSGAGAVMSDVAAGGPGLVAVGSVACANAHFNGGDPAVWVSADGSSWQLILLDPGVRGEVSYSGANRVVVGPGGIVAVGQVGDLPSTGAGLGLGLGHRYGAVWISRDGIDWRLAGVLDHSPLEDTPSARYGAYAGDALWENGNLVVAGAVTTRNGDHAAYGVVWISPDLGLTWYEPQMGQADPSYSDDLGIAWGFNTEQGLMNHVARFGSQIIGVGTGVVWLGEWPAG